MVQAQQRLRLLSSITLMRRVQHEVAEVAKGFPEGSVTISSTTLGTVPSSKCPYFPTTAELAVCPAQYFMQFYILALLCRVRVKTLQEKEKENIEHSISYSCTRT